MCGVDASILMSEWYTFCFIFNSLLFLHFVSMHAFTCLDVLICEILK
jgi:hypothetical protein